MNCHEKKYVGVPRKESGSHYTGLDVISTTSNGFVSERVHVIFILMLAILSSVRDIPLPSRAK